jgi:hypothetical protein
MIKFNYNEPEFKVIVSATEDVIATSLDPVDLTWDTGSNNGEIPIPMD